MEKIITCSNDNYVKYMTLAPLPEIIIQKYATGDKGTDFLEKGYGYFQDALENKDQKGYEKAVECYQKAAELGNVDAYIALSICYQYGKGAAVDPVQEKKMCEMAVKLQKQKVCRLMRMTESEMSGKEKTETHKVGIPNSGPKVKKTVKSADTDKTSNSKTVQFFGPGVSGHSSVSKTVSSTNNIDKKKTSSGMILHKGDYSGTSWSIDAAGKNLVIHSFDKSGSSSRERGEYWNNVATIVIEEGITEIPGSAFKNMHSLKKVVFPRTLQRIGFESFQECDLLDEIIIPESVTVIAAHAFEKCVNLKKISIPPTVTYIGEDAFFKCPCGMIHVQKSCAVCIGNWQIRATL